MTGVQNDVDPRPAGAALSESPLAGARVLVTGGFGFIGSSFAHRCVAEGARVRVLDCSLPGSGANQANLAGIWDEVEVIEGDLRDRDVVTAAVQNVDYVLHSAAQTSHTHSMTDSLLSLDVNCRGTLELLEAIRRDPGQPRFVHVGTTTQLGPMVQEPVDESHPEFPRDMYSATMVGSEKFVLIYAHAHGLQATVVRLSNTYGPRAAIHSADLGFANYFIGRALQGEGLTIYGDGSQLRSLLYIDDAVDALYRAALSPLTAGEVFFASSDRTYSVIEISDAIVRHLGGWIETIPWPEGRKAIDVGNAVIDSTKIRRMLGWEPAVDLEAGLARTRDFYRELAGTYLGGVQ